MVILLQFCFIALLLLFWKGSNACYKIIVSVQIASFVCAPLVANIVTFNTIRTYLNTLFCLINLFLITAPWRNTYFEFVEVSNVDFYRFYKKILYIILGITIAVNLIVLATVVFFIRDIAVFKAELGFHELYDKIPYFGLLFRYSSVSRNFGLLALPICIYYIQNEDLKNAIKAFLMSTSTLLASLASYSRAGILSYVLICVCLFFYSFRVFGVRIKRFIKRNIKRFVIILVIIFSSITVSRFSSSVMWYYGDRIPSESIIKDPVLYSVFDYTSMGFPKGVMQLEVHDREDVLNGEPLIYDLKLILSYFHLISWEPDDYFARLKNAYNKPGLDEYNNNSSFHGYTCRMVKTMGYICTSLVSLLFYRYVRKKSIKRIISVKTLSVLTFLLYVSINSIFYSLFSEALFPLIFYFVVSSIYALSHRRIVIKLPSRKV